ncbi:DUF3237 domain-containing protein [Solimonas fluminis]|uniref:DUF3237 domain-containing protein n=1 Tax=Solimonas fluminis TaxID=2086571 RepID=A0A2S5TJP8_9GAMM|nr:DUF3237 domain-containing protein [Solimonas fluminis]PPE75172.1 DUF3237 domain-containing protein [Solimonas fluminis]
MTQQATTLPGCEYLFTLHSPTGGLPQAIDASLTIYQAGPGGWARGPRLEAQILAPTGDWLRAMPGGSLRVDARMTLQASDGALIHASYGGVIGIAPENFARMGGGGTLTAQEMYFFTTPCFQTAHPEYAWLNRVQAVGRAVELKGGPEGYVRYEVFALR